MKGDVILSLRAQNKGPFALSGLSDDIWISPKKMVMEHLSLSRIQLKWLLYEMDTLDSLDENTEQLEPVIGKIHQAISQILQGADKGKFSVRDGHQKIARPILQGAFGANYQNTIKIVVNNDLPTGTVL